jgi:hypothetical protein
MKMANARIGIGVLLGVASVATLLGTSVFKSGFGRVRETIRTRRGSAEGEYTHGGHIPAPQGREKVEVTEIGGVP